VCQKSFSSLQQRFGEDVRYELSVEKAGRAIRHGIGILLYATTTTGGIHGASSIGGRNIRAEKVGKEASRFLAKNLSKRGTVLFVFQLI